MINRHQNGNAMVYILIAISLFGALTLVLSRQNNNADEQNLDEEMVALYVNELVEYVGSTQNVVDMMMSSGSDFGDLNFVNPTSTGFNTGTPVHKVFHPQGGGLNYRATMSEDITNGVTSQWAINTNINVEWTKSTSTDVIMTAYFINRDVCAKINEQITGSAAIPATASPHTEYFLDTGTTNLDTTECAGCDGYASLCVENDTGDNYSFYNIILAR